MNKLNNLAIAGKIKMDMVKENFFEILENNDGAGAFDTAVIILVGVVLAGIVLAGLVTIINATVMPGLTDKITDLFNYEG